MRRLRPLSEAECYARCYGGWDASVHVMRRSSLSPKQPSAVPDVLSTDLRVVFCGINPGRISAVAAAHFANPRNDFWRLLHEAGFTSRLYEPREQQEVLAEGIGLANAAYRTTPGSGDLRRGDFEGAAERLDQMAHELRPRWLRVLAALSEPIRDREWAR